MLDAVLPRLSLLEQAVYLRLYRLTYGFRREVCIVGYPSLARACNVTDRAVQKACQRLVDLGLVERVGATLGGAGMRGNHYRVVGPSLEPRSTLEQRSRVEPPSRMKEKRESKHETAPVAVAPAPLSVYDVRRIVARLSELHHGEAEYTRERLKADVRTALAGQGNEADESLIEEALHP